MFRSMLCSLLPTGSTLGSPVHIEPSGDAFASCTIGRICAYSKPNYDGKLLVLSSTKCVKFPARSLANFTKRATKNAASGDRIELGVPDHDPVAVYDTPNCASGGPHHWFLFSGGASVPELKFRSTKAAPSSLRVLPKSEWAKAYRDEKALGPGRQ